MSSVWARVKLIFSLGRARLIEHERVQARVFADEILPNLARVEPYGFSYRPKPDAQTYLLFPSGDRSFGVAILIGDKRYQMQLQEGEVALHDDEGNHVHLARGGNINVHAAGAITLTAGSAVNMTAGSAVNIEAPLVKVNTNEARIEAPLLDVTGEVLDNSSGGGKKMSAMRETFNTHVHPENDNGGPTRVPNQLM